MFYKMLGFRVSGISLLADVQNELELEEEEEEVTVVGCRDRSIDQGGRRS